MDKRLKVLFGLFIIILLLIIARLFYWQILLSDQFKADADTQRIKNLKIPARRGTIMASDGSLLVANKRSFLIYAQPHQIKDLENAKELLSNILAIPIASISSRLKDDKLVWVPIAHKVEEYKKIKLQSKHIDGIGVEEEDSRYYPEGSMAAQLLGFEGKNAKGDDTGYFGLEGYYDRQLQGRDGFLSQETDAKGLPILIGEQKRVEPQDGRNLILNIDKSIQFIIEGKLAEAVQKYGAKGGLVVVLEPQTGAILGLAGYPSYDPGSYADYDSNLYKSPAVADSYEPGSTFKVLVMAAALNEKKVTPSMEFEETGPLQVGGYTIRTWNNKYSGKITATGILEKSSNVGMVEVGKLLARDKLVNYIKSFGIGTPSGIDLEEETSPQLRPRDKWYDIDYATLTFGQGIAVTPIQMVRALGAIANDGKLMEPHIVKTIADPDGKTIDIRPKEITRVISSDTAHILSEMMVAAVDNGEAKFAKPRGFRIAGKTGTAQIPIAGHYDASKTIASFVGFAPVPNPKFVMLTTLREPTSSPWGSETAAPLFFNIAQDLFNYYGISPTQ